MAISPQRIIRSTSCLVLGWGFLGRRIEWRYIRFEQIEDGSRRHLGKISDGHISATGRPIHFQEAAARHLGKFRMNIGLSLECCICSIFMTASWQEYGRE